MQYVRPALIAAALVSALACVARADDIGPEVAKRLLSEGRIRPLTEIVEAVRKQIPGELIEVELEIEEGIYVYDVKLLGPNGRVQEVETDAATGKILKVEDDD